MDIKIYFDGKEFTQAEYNTYILYKYLTKHYDKDIARKVIEKSKDLNVVAKALGKEDIAFFCLYFLQDIFVVKDNNEARNLAPTHYEIWDLFNVTFVKDKIDKINIICPRGLAKTTMGTLALTVWLVCYGKSKFTLIGAKKDTDAQQFIDSIKKVFQENEKIIDNFGKLIDKKKKNNANEIEFSNGMYIRAVGSASSVRGANFKGIRPSCVIADDYQDERDILTEDAREKKYNKWTKEIENVGDTAVYRNGKKVKSATKIVSIGTVLHNSCLISQIARNKDYYTLYKQAVTLKEGQTIEDIFETDLWLECKKIYFDDKIDNSKMAAKQFYEENKENMKFPILWEEKWDCFEDIAVPYLENRESFMSEMMNDASSIGEKWIRSNRTQSKEDIENHNFNKTMLGVDPAGVNNKRKGDYFAFVVESVGDNDFKYVRKGEILRFNTFNQYIQHMIDILHKFDDITHVYIEKNNYLGVDANKLEEMIYKDKELSGRNIEIINKAEHRNKDEKISTITDDVNNGRIIFCEERVMEEAIEQMMEFQGEKYTKNDDFIDCLAATTIEIDNIEEYGELQIYDIRDRKSVV